MMVSYSIFTVAEMIQCEVTSVSYKVFLFLYVFVIDRQNVLLAIDVKVNQLFLDFAIVILK
jgi:hypothetical protein